MLCPIHLRFAFLTDLHVSPGNENDSGLQLLIEEINSLPLDFVVITGDLTNTGSNDELYAVEQRPEKTKSHLLYHTRQPRDQLVRISRFTF
jgi:3',5'-cyclic AMP phosphodiesterase CpdA